MKKLMRKVYLIVGALKRFMGLKPVRDGFTRPIWLKPYQGGVAFKPKGSSSPRETEPEATVVLVNYPGTIPAHHRFEDKVYCIGSRRCKSWTEAEWELAMSEYVTGYSLQEIARMHERTYSSVASKFRAIRKKGLVQQKTR